MIADWTDLAFGALLTVATSNHYFTTDDIWKILEEHPVEPRSMGVVMRRASKLGLIINTHRTRPSVRARAASSRPNRKYVWSASRTKPENRR